MPEIRFMPAHVARSLPLHIRAETTCHYDCMWDNGDVNCLSTRIIVDLRLGRFSAPPGVGGGGPTRANQMGEIPFQRSTGID